MVHTVRFLVRITYMRIFIIAYYHDQRLKKKAGGLIRMYELAENLIKLGHDVRMILPGIGNPESQTTAPLTTIPIIDIPVLRPLSFHFLSSLYLLAVIWKNADLLYVRQMNSALPSLIASIAGKQSIYEIPNDPFIDYLSLSKTKRMFVQIMDRLSIALSEKVVVLSEWSKSRLRLLGKVEKSRILVMPSGTDTELFKPLSKEVCCQQLNLPASFFYVGFIGTFLHCQGVDSLISAAQIILKQQTNVKFLLVGDGPMRQEWLSMVEQGNLKESFIFTGQIPYKEMPKYIGAMDICVAPHRKDSNQASPVKLFDYMACGKPIVASSIEVVHEITAPANCALLFPPSDSSGLAKSIIQLICDHELREKLGLNGRVHAIANYDRRLIVETFARIIEHAPV